MYICQQKLCSLIKAGNIIIETISDIEQMQMQNTCFRAVMPNVTVFEQTINKVMVVEVLCMVNY